MKYVSRVVTVSFKNAAQGDEKEKSRRTESERLQRDSCDGDATL